MGIGTIRNLAGLLETAEIVVGVIEATPATAIVRATNCVTPSVTDTSMDTGTGIGSRSIITEVDATNGAMSEIDISAGGEQKIQRRVTDSKGAEGTALSASVTRRLSLFASSDDRQRRI